VRARDTRKPATPFGTVPTRARTARPLLSSHGREDRTVLPPSACTHANDARNHKGPCTSNGVVVTLLVQGLKTAHHLRAPVAAPNT